MRRPLLAAALATTLLLAACGSDDEPAETPASSPSETTVGGEAPPSEADVAALAAVAVEGPLGAAPTVTFDTPLEVSTTVSRLDTPGSGAPLGDGDLLTVHYVIVDGSTGQAMSSTWDYDAPQAFLLGDPNLPSAMSSVLAQQSVGARFLLAVPGTPASELAEGTPTSLFVFEVVDVAPGRATGTEVTPPEGLPTVTLADDGAPSLAVGDAAEPTELVAQTLIEGSGDVVEAGDLITVHYSGWLWDGTTFDSSWEGGSPLQTTIGAGQVIQGWDQGLVGKTVGSQVLLLIPAELGYGDRGQGSIPPGATLVFVVDILAAS